MSGIDTDEFMSISFDFKNDWVLAIIRVYLISTMSHSNVNLHPTIFC
jgi:hypothetical protein